MYWSIFIFESAYLIIIDEGKTAAPVHALIEMSLILRSDDKIYKVEFDNYNLAKEEMVTA